MFLTLNFFLHAPGIGELIGLHPQRLYARAFRGIQHFKLQGGLIGSDAHLTTQCVDFPDDDPFGRAADRRIARHLADVFQT